MVGWKLQTLPEVHVRQILGLLSPKDLEALLKTGWASPFRRMLALYAPNSSLDQQAALRLVLNESGNVVVLGPAGTGKTTLIRAAKELLQATGRTSATYAYTGIASLNVEGTTLHRGFRGLGSLRNRWDNDRRAPSTKRVGRHWGPLPDVIFVDEISMLDAGVWEQIMWLTAFSPGLRWVLVGDFRQLGAVSPIDKQRPYLFQCPEYLAYRVTKLTVCHRQRSDLPLYKALTELGDGKWTQAMEDFLWDRESAYYTLGPLERKQILHLFHTNDKVGTFNSEAFLALGTEAFIPTFQISGAYQVCVNKRSGIAIRSELEMDYKLSETIEAALSQEGLRRNPLKPGCPVIFTRNISAQIRNGTRAVVLGGFLDGSMDVILDGHEDITHVVPLALDVTFRNFEDSSFAYEDRVNVICIPVLLAYAITIYRSQSLTLPRVAISLKGLPSSNLAYVALSRCPTSDGIYVVDWREPRSMLEPRLQQYIRS
jgi:ATP-dependent DNA helicase PIF1